MAGILLLLYLSVTFIAFALAYRVSIMAAQQRRIPNIGEILSGRQLRGRGVVAFSMGVGFLCMVCALWMFASFPVKVSDGYAFLRPILGLLLLMVLFVFAFLAKMRKSVADRQIFSSREVIGYALFILVIIFVSKFKG